MPNSADLAAHFLPVFDRIREGTVARERARQLPHEEIRWLREVGFGAIRVPSEHGGLGVSLEQFFALLVDLGAADSNLPQALRQHFFNVEMYTLRETVEASGTWVDRILAGDLFGNATTEPANARIGDIGTVLTSHPDGGLRLNGTKIYTTGNLFAQWIPVVAVDDDGNQLVVTVPADRAGVLIADDWNGFGQKHTSTGTTVFTDVHVDEAEVNRRGQTDSLLGAGFHQLILLATLAGIATAASHDVVLEVQKRNRVYSGGSGSLVRHDPLIQEVVGQIEATAVATRAIVASAARSLDSAWTAWNTAGYDYRSVEDAFIAAEIEISAAQVSVIPLVLASTGKIFDALGASATDNELALDRHWRNARTVASHNPHVYKARLVGDHALNGTRPPAFFAGSDVGVAPTASA